MSSLEVVFNLFFYSFWMSPVVGFLFLTRYFYLEMDKVMQKPPCSYWGNVDIDVQCPPVPLD